ncbi:MipA/OmpV family protein [Telluria beijingensis]|uniref:MipA/OmpV family protein n=1 Tax=Telluria beijingensis TaxID=3068633 RepID=UPI0027954629|nr:MipA/OmpV family protein [Massilia sp. REN29]
MPTPPFLQRHLAHLSLLAATMIWSLPALAQPGGDGPPQSSWALGVGAITMDKAYAGIDRENMAIPFVQYENRWVSIIGPQLGFKLLSLEPAASHTINVDLVARYDGSGYDDDDIEDTPILAGMRERKSGFWAGARIEWKSDWFDVTAEALGDASGNSKGKRFNLGLEKTWHIGERVMITPRVAANWHDKKYVDYYYGVRADEVRAGRAAYRGESGVNAEVGVRGIYMFDQRHSVFVDFEVTRLAKEIKDSPLVDKSTENRVFLGYLYRFK